MLCRYFLIPCYAAKKKYPKTNCINNYPLQTFKMQKVIIEDKFNLFSEYWSPKIVGELNGQHVKLAKLKGEFVWHKHDEEDEMFLVMDGVLKMELRDKTIVINKNEFLIVPKGTEHRPVADSEVLVMLFEPATTLNTGNTENEMTKHFLETI